MLFQEYAGLGGNVEYLKNEVELQAATSLPYDFVSIWIYVFLKLCVASLLKIFMCIFLF